MSFTQELLNKRPCLTRHGVVGSRLALHPRLTVPPCRARRRRSVRRQGGGHGRGGPPLPDPARLRGKSDAVMINDFITCPAGRKSLSRCHTYGHRVKFNIRQEIEKGLNSTTLKLKT